MFELTDEDIQLYRAAAQKWGEDVQTTMLMEECGELVAAVHHHKRGRIDAMDLLSEMADVLNAMGQVIVLLGEEYDCTPYQVQEDLQRCLFRSKAKLTRMVKDAT